MEIDAIDAKAEWISFKYSKEGDFEALKEDIAAAIREAVEGERDACAELSYSFSDPTPPALIGDAIRGRALSGEK